MLLIRWQWPKVNLRGQVQNNFQTALMSLLQNAKCGVYAAINTTKQFIFIFGHSRLMLWVNSIQT
jgi:hypothetical protein